MVCMNCGNKLTQLEVPSFYEIENDYVFIMQVMGRLYQVERCEVCYRLEKLEKYYGEYNKTTPVKIRTDP